MRASRWLSGVVIVALVIAWPVSAATSPGIEEESYVSHAPVRIDGDDDFVPAGGGWALMGVMSPPPIVILASEIPPVCTGGISLVAGYDPVTQTYTVYYTTPACHSQISFWSPGWDTGSGVTLAEC